MKTHTDDRLRRLRRQRDDRVVRGGGRLGRRLHGGRTEASAGTPEADAGADPEPDDQSDRRAVARPDASDTESDTESAERYS